MPQTPSSAATPWWQGAAIYQIYPRSFQDSDGDGVGDLAGAAQRLEHVAALGVDAIWVSPFYTSPMRDFGYDVSNYCDVDPLFGALEDFDALVARAHELGLKVIVDQVYAHTSDLHPWFAESRASRANDKADWYVWADPKPDGTPPCNWQSVFGGPAWTWDGRRGQYYMHTFLKEQPQLNVHNGEVQDALLDVARFWLSRGVDGFRLDALNHAMHDPQFHDNPPAPDTGKVRTRPFDFQIKTYSQSHPDMIGFVERLASVCREYGAVHTVAEIGGDNARKERIDYTAGPTRLDSAYGFDFLYASSLTPQFVADALAGWDETWPTWAFENHDAPRAVTRWSAPEHREAFARMKCALLLSLRGNVILYQGEELGLEQDVIPFEQLQDPEAIANWPLTLSRDGARTPMPWDGSPHGGFTSGMPWLPVSDMNMAHNAAAQANDPSSLLSFTRHVLALRKSLPPLRTGALTDLIADGSLLSFTRQAGSESIRCLFNLGTDAVALAPEERGEAVLSVNGAHLSEMPPYGALWLRG
jgi:alpha-glucosidase